MRSHEFAPGLQIRGIEPPLRLADYKPVAFDRDSTLINVECVDEIADVVGREAEIAGAAMRGEIAGYKDSLINLSAPSTSPRTASALAVPLLVMPIQFGVERQRRQQLVEAASAEQCAVAERPGSLSGS